jgi:two-component system KDP operon response regulator KdpE
LPQRRQRRIRGRKPADRERRDAQPQALDKTMTPAQKILVAEDDAAVRDFITRNLRARDFIVFEADNGASAIALWEAHLPNLLVLDVMMPRVDGLQVCKRVRDTSTTPIIVLSALDSDEDKVAALDLGADDYLTKPFAVDELLARVRAVLRRSQWTPQSAEALNGALRIGAFVLDPGSREVYVNGVKIMLTRVEFDVLAQLMGNAGKVVTHRALLRRVWGEEYGNEAEYLRVYLNRLRRKIEVEPSHPRHLLNEQGLGYKFVP